MGGKAFKGKTSSITRVNCLATIDKLDEWVFKPLGLSRSHWVTLGSTAKKEISGDIDIGIDSNKVSQEELFKQVQKITLEAKFLPGKTIISFPMLIMNIDHQQFGEYVQVDLMITDDIKFSEWIYYSPSESESPYKGLYRNSLLSAISHYSERSIIHHNEDGELVWLRYILNFNSGLRRVVESSVSKNKKLLKTPKIIRDGKPSKDIQTIHRILFGKEYEDNRVLTFEEAFSIFTSEGFKHKKYRNEIINRMKKDLDSKGVVYPHEVLEY